MYINLDKRKKKIKRYKILKKDVHGKILKKKRILSSFYLVYAKIMFKQFLFLNNLYQRFLNNKNLFLELEKFIDKNIMFSTLLIMLRYNKNNISEDFYLPKISEEIISYKFKNQFLSYNLVKRNSKGNNESYKDKATFILHKTFFTLYFSVTKSQYRSYFKKAMGKKGAYLNNFFNIIESRLDMLIYRSFSNLSIELIKQMILHKKIYVNNTKITYYSYLIKKEDIVSFFNINTLENIDVFFFMYKYMKAQMINISNNFYLFKYPKYLMVDFNSLLIMLIEDKFSSEDIPNFFKYEFKSYNKLSFT